MQRPNRRTRHGKAIPSWSNAAQWITPESPEIRARTRLPFDFEVVRCRLIPRGRHPLRAAEGQRCRIGRARG